MSAHNDVAPAAPAAATEQTPAGAADDAPRPPVEASTAEVPAAETATVAEPAPEEPTAPDGSSGGGGGEAAAAPSPSPVRAEEDHEADHANAADRRSNMNSSIKAAADEEEGNDEAPRRRDAKVQFKPGVSIAENIFEESPAPADFGGDVCERLYEEGKQAREERERRAAAERERRAAAELEGVTFKPRIAESGIKYESFDQFHQSQVEWSKRKAKLFSEKARKLNLEREEDMTFATRPSKKSEQLIRTMEKEQRYRGPVKGWKDHFNRFAARLAAQSELLEPNNNNKESSGGSIAKKNATPTATGSPRPESGRRRSRSADVSARRAPFIPLISPRASASRGGGGAGKGESVFSKLYEDSILRSAAQRVIARTKEEKERQGFFHPATNDALWVTLDGGGDDYHDDGGGGAYESLLLLGGEEEGSEAAAGSFSFRSSSFRRRPDEVVESLLLKGEEYQHRREQRQRRIREEEAATLSFKPSTNKNSRRLIQQYAQVTPRVPPPPPPPPPITALSREVKGVAEKPARRFDVDLFWSRMERGEAQKAQKIEARRAMLETAAVSECTFRPSITKASERYAARSAHDGFPAAAPAAFAADSLAGAAPLSGARRRRQQQQREREQSAVAEYDRPGLQRRKQPASQQRAVEGRNSPPGASAPIGRPGNNNSSSSNIGDRAYTKGQLDAPQPPTAHSFFGADRRGEGHSPSHADRRAPARTAYLSELESELRGVIAEWQTISDDG